MKFYEKWYWANYLRNENPITAAVVGLIHGLWIPIVLSAVFCLFTDPQWRGQEGFSGFSIGSYLSYFCFFWKTIFVTIWTFTAEYASYAWNHFGSIAKFVRKVMWLDPAPD